MHQTIDKVTRDVEERIQLNTAVAALMELVNEIHRLESARRRGSTAGTAALREALETLVLLLGPFTPHVCEEMWERLGTQDGLVRAAWPAFDAAAAREDEVELAVQVNGKVRGRITVPRDAGEGEVREKALAEPRVAEQLAGPDDRQVRGRPRPSRERGGEVRRRQFLAVVGGRGIGRPAAATRCRAAASRPTRR